MSPMFLFRYVYYVLFFGLIICQHFRDILRCQLSRAGARMSRNDRYFKLDRFHSLIVNVLSDDTEPWVVETLDYLTQYLLFYFHIIIFDIFMKTGTIIE